MSLVSKSVDLLLVLAESATRLAVKVMDEQSPAIVMFGPVHPHYLHGNMLTVLAV